MGDSPYSISLWSSGENEQRWLAGRLQRSIAKREITTRESSRSASPKASPAGEQPQHLTQSNRSTSSDAGASRRRPTSLPGIDEDDSSRTSFGEASFDTTMPLPRDKSLRHIAKAIRPLSHSSAEQETIQTKREEMAKTMTAFQDENRRSIPPLKLTDTQLVAFQRQWSHGTRVYQQIQAELRPMHDIFLVVSLLCLFVPLELAVLSVTRHDFSLDGGYGAMVHASNTLRILIIWMIPSLGIIDVICATRCTLRLRETTRSLATLTYARPHDRTIVDHITRLPDLCTWHITSLKLAVAPSSLLVLLAIFVASAVPWAWVRLSAGEASS